MANVNTIKTRILNKYDLLANYSNFTPLKGEVCIAVVGETATENQGLKGDITKKPIVGIKVGDGINKFNDLPWVQAVAGDVSTFVKGIVDEDKFNELVNALITNANLATAAQLKEVSDALDALTARVGTAEGKITNIETAINTGDNSLANLRAAINNVLGTSGDTSDANTVYGAKKYAEEKAAAAQAAAESTAEGLYEKKDVAAGLVNTLKNTEVKANTDAIDAINTKIGETSIGEGTTITAAIKTLQDSVGTSGSESLGSKVAALEEAVGDSTKGLVADVADHETRISTLEEEMDVVQAATAGYNANNTISAAFETANDAIEAVDAKAEQNKTDIATEKGRIDTLIGTVEGDNAMSVRDIAIDVLTEKLIAEDADEALNTLEEIAAWIQSHPDDASAMNAAIAAVKQNLGFTGENLETAPATVDARIASAIAALEIGNYATTDALDAVSNRVKTIEEAPYATTGNVATAKSEVIGVSGDTKDADTIYGAKAFATDAAATAKSEAITAAANDAAAKYELKDVAKGLVDSLKANEIKTNADAIDALDAKVNSLVESDDNTGMVSGVTQDAETGKISVAHRAITHTDLDTNDVFVFYCGNATGYAADMASVEI